MDSKDEDTSNVRVPVNSLFSPSEGPSEGFGKLDSIFEEVEKNLPSIDFDVSDVSLLSIALNNYNCLKLKS